MSIVVVLSIGALLRIKDQNLILGVRLDESDKRQKEIARKNEQLQDEIAERKEYEKALRASEKKYRELHESMRDGFVCLDTQGKILECNSAFREMLGFNTEEIQSLSYEALSPAKWHTPEAEIIAEQVLARGYSDIYEKECLRKDQTTFPAELRTYLLSDQAGNTAGTWAIVRDISDRKRAEEELTRAKNAAEAANRAKSEFLANMSHELRTPLNHIIGFTELVIFKHFGELNEQQEEYLNDVLQSSRHLLSLINDVLDISKVEAGKLELDLSNVNLKALLEQSLTMIKEKALTRRIQLSTRFEGLPSTVKVDERKLKQIIYNLLSNAAKFTGAGESICLSARCLSKNNGHLVTRDGRRLGPPNENWEEGAKGHLKFIEIAVRDTGIGLKTEDIARIFEPFEQVESSASRKYQGTGLGLSLCKNLVELHGGQIWAESKGEGLGSTFRLVIPLLT
ncbi:MAG: PAS domain S-box protein [Desulfobacterales bacterium]|nr:MAG: PAS domain S-box protein [Desulfobacterales bacterium]